MEKFNKYISLIFIVLCTFFSIIYTTSGASAGTIRTNDGDGVILRSEATRNSANLASVPENARVTILNTNGPTENGCGSNKWYQVSYSGKTGYICSKYIIEDEVIDVEIDPNGDFETQMLARGFTPSYLPALKALHQKYPNWNFKAIKTNMDYNSALDAQSIPGMAAVDGSDTTLRYVNDFGNYVVIEPGWYAASRSTVSYYMDPRNFLSERYIFMFENLQYISSCQTKAGVQTVLGSTYMPLRLPTYADVFMQAATSYNVNPIHLASRVKQETWKGGTIGSESTTGEKFTFTFDQNCYDNLSKNAYNTAWDLENSCGNDKEYSNLYNFFNIGAYSSYASPVYRGLIWANGGFDGSVTTYQRPWNNPTSAILGGSQYIANQYINKEQNTGYFERFNVNPKAFQYNAAHTHQYMTNIRAHYSEASKTYDAYLSMGLINSNSTFEFLIPVFNNMPNETELPTIPVPPPPQPVIPKVEVNTIISGAGYKLNNNYMSNISIGKTIDSITSDLKAVSSDAIVTVKDANNNTKTGAIGTGDKITVSNGSEQKQYTAIIYGDVNGDGSISILDLLRVQKKLLNSVKLSNDQIIAADNNKDGKITVVDLLRVQKHILKSISIEQ